jgi:hypothetical protein
MLLLISRDGVIDFVWALDLADPKYPGLAAKGPLELTAIEMCCDLRTLKLEPGDQILRMAESETPLVPAPEQVSVSTINGSEQTEWAPAVGLTELGLKVLRSLNVPDDNMCDLYRIPLVGRDHSYMAAGTSTTPTFALELPDGTALIGGRGGLLLHVSMDSKVPLTSVSTTTPHHAAAIGGDGLIYLMSDDGRLARGTIAGGFEELPVRGIGGARRYVDLTASKPGFDFELFAVNDSRALERFDGVRFTTLSTQAPYQIQVERDLARPSVLWLGPNEAIATNVARAQDRTTHWRRGMIQERRPSRDTQLELYDFEGIGIFVGDRDGRITKWEGSTWGESKGVAGGPLFALHPLGNGFLAYAIFNGFWQYHPQTGACPVEVGLTGHLPAAMVSIGEDAILSIEATITGQPGMLRMTLIEKQGEVAPCLKDAGR